MIKWKEVKLQPVYGFFFCIFAVHIIVFCLDGEFDTLLHPRSSSGTSKLHFLLKTFHNILKELVYSPIHSSVAIALPILPCCDERFRSLQPSFFLTGSLGACAWHVPDMCHCCTIAIPAAISPFLGRGHFQLNHHQWIFFPKPKPCRVSLLRYRDLEFSSCRIQQSHSSARLWVCCKVSPLPSPEGLPFISHHIFHLTPVWKWCPKVDSRNFLRGNPTLRGGVSKQPVLFFLAINSQRACGPPPGGDPQECGLHSHVILKTLGHF